MCNHWCFFNRNLKLIAFAFGLLPWNLLHAPASFRVNSRSRSSFYVLRSRTRLTEIYSSTPLFRTEVTLLLYSSVLTIHFTTCAPPRSWNRHAHLTSTVRYLFNTRVLVAVTSLRATQLVLLYPKIRYGIVVLLQTTAVRA